MSDHTDRGLVWQETWRPIYWLILACIASAFIFLAVPTLDLYVAGLFADGENGFPLSHHPVPQFFNDMINNLGLTLAVFVIAGLAITSIGKRKILNWSARTYAFFFACLTVGPGLIVNGVFKSFWGRARPRHLLEFGGDKEFSPALLISDQCSNNCSFVSGDAALAFALFAFAIAFTRTHKPDAIASLAFGIFIGGIRMVQGAHFLSDIAFSGLFTLLTIYLLKALILDPIAFPLSRTELSKFLNTVGLRTKPERTHQSQLSFKNFFRANPKDLGVPSAPK